MRCVPPVRALRSICLLLAAGLAGPAAGGGASAPMSVSVTVVRRAIVGPRAAAAPAAGTPPTAGGRPSPAPPPGALTLVGADGPRTTRPGGS